MEDLRVKEEKLTAHSLTGRMPFEIDSPFRDPIRKSIFSVLKRPLEKLFHLHTLNRIYNQTSIPGEESIFTERALRVMNVTYDISDEDRERIPEEGPVVVVANHPFGAIEGIVLAELLKSVRKDFKILANYLLNRIVEMRPLLISVDPFGSRRAKMRNIKPLKEAIKLVGSGGLLGIFPSGEVSHFSLRNREVTDPHWSRTIAGIIRKSGAKVVPLYFSGRNSTFFQIMGLIHPRLRTILLPREFLNKRNRKISIRVGNPIPFKRLDEFLNDDDLMDYIRMRTYLLAGRTEADEGRSQLFEGANGHSSKLKPVAPPDHNKTLADEVDSIPEDDILARKGDFVVYVAKMQNIPGVMREIGRLREITFREAGEGTGKAIDLDKYDTHYLHLFVWNREKKHIIGSYRLGLTDIIMDRHGMKGLYTTSLFRFKKSLLEQITPAIELGRSFIRPEYQKEYAPLNLLWKAIGQFIVRNPRYKMLFGPVSINNRYQSASRQLLVSFLTHNKFNADLARLVKPKTPPKRRRNTGSLEEPIIGHLVADLDEVSHLISEIEADQQSVPILLKHYLKLGGVLLGFNIDSEFSDVLDGLILVDLTKTPQRILEKYMGPEGFERFREYHQERGDRFQPATDLTGVNPADRPDPMNP